MKENKYGFNLDKETLESIVFLLAYDFASATISEEGLNVYMCVNDTFAYSTADCEEIPLDEIKPLVDEMLKFHNDDTIPNPAWYPILIWAQKKRGREFIPPVKKDVDEFLAGIGNAK